MDNLAVISSTTGWEASEWAGGVTEVVQRQNRTFFLFSYEYIKQCRRNSPERQSDRTYGRAARGDFSALLR